VVVPVPVLPVPVPGLSVVPGAGQTMSRLCPAFVFTRCAASFPRLVRELPPALGLAAGAQTGVLLLCGAERAGAEKMWVTDGCVSPVCLTRRARPLVTNPSRAASSPAEASGPDDRRDAARDDLRED
jgi:hypothetical protein